jgi:hypothetical protein
MDDLRNELRTRLEAGDDLAALREVLVLFRDRGGTQNAAVVVLEELREEAPDEATDDLLCDVLDFAVGWCSPHSRVW